MMRIHADRCAISGCLVLVEQSGHLGSNMKSKRCVSFAVLLTVNALCPGLDAFSAGFAFQGLGDLPGGPFNSVPTSLSADGAVVVGTSNSAKGPQAFRWTAANGMLGLGDLPGGTLPAMQRLSRRTAQPSWELPMSLGTAQRMASKHFAGQQPME